MGKKRLLSSVYSMQSSPFPSFRRSNLLWFFSGVVSTLAIVFYALYRIEASQGIPRSSTTSTTSHLKGSTHPIPVPMQPFPEPAWRTPSTLDVLTVASTPFARFEIHKVKTENGKIVNDWLWTDERAHVNILVHLQEQNKYMLFYQSKYGLEGKKHATVGGLFNVGDTPLSCAKRELLEETGLETKEMIYLGAYRVQVNRGGGILHAFFARNCVRSHSWKASDDYEKQEMRLLTREQLLNITLSGDIGEAQWLATVSTALLHEEYQATVMRNRTLFTV